jgi:hypothetical protein
MRALEPDKPTEVCHEIHIVIDIPDHYIEVIEVHRSIETGSVLVHVILVQEIETHADQRQSFIIPFRRLES